MIKRGTQKGEMRSGQDWLTPGRFALLLALMIFIPFRQVLQGSQTFAVRDFGLFSYPVANYLRDSFWRGEWPLWNPLSCCGTPFLAQLNTLTLYPPSLIYLLLPLTWARLSPEPSSPSTAFPSISSCGPVISPPSPSCRG
jgi:hypothetical protein